MVHIHITLVGNQTYPVYLGIAEDEISPDMVILVHSENSLTEAQRIAAEFADSNIEFRYELCNPVNVKQVLAKAKELAQSMSDDNHYTINLTSGTKVWSIIFHEAFENKPNVKFIYVDQTCNIYDLSTGEMRMGAAIDTHRVFRLNGTSALRYLRFEDLTEEDLDAITRIRQLTRVNRAAVTDVTNYEFSKARNRRRDKFESVKFPGSSIAWDLDKKEVTLTITNKKTVATDTISSPHIFSLMFNAGWFEAEVARQLSFWKHSREIMLNVVFPYSERVAKNEIDIIVNTGNRLLFVECKTSIHSVTDLDKFSKAVRNFGGTGCHAMFVSYSSMGDKPSEKCRDNNIIPFSFQDTLNAVNSGEVPLSDGNPITNALCALLDKKLSTINKK